LELRVLSSLQTPLGKAYLVELNGQRFIVIKDGQKVKVLSEILPSEENLKALSEGRLPPLAAEVRNPELVALFSYRL